MAAKLNTAKVLQRRKQLGLTQAEAAEAAGLGGKAPKQNWSNIENGVRDNPTLDVLTKIAAVLRCRVRDLLEDDDKPDDKPDAKPAAKAKT